MLFGRLVSLIDASLQHLAISAANYVTLDAHDHQKGTRYCLFSHSRPRIKQHVLRWSYETRDQKPDHVLPMSAIKIFVREARRYACVAYEPWKISVYSFSTSSAFQESSDSSKSEHARFERSRTFWPLVRFNRNRSVYVSPELIHESIINPRIDQYLVVNDLSERLDTADW